MNKYKTGGGPEVNSKLDEIDLRAISVCQGQFEPIDNDFDDDAGFHKTVDTQDQYQNVRISIFILLTLLPLFYFILFLNYIYKYMNY